MTPSHPVVAALLDPMMAPLRGIRERLIPPIEGDVLEIGAGTGENFRLYENAGSVLALEPDPHMRRRAEGKLSDAKVSITVLDAGAEALPCAAHRFDAVVCTWVLCTIPRVEEALSEMYRVLKPGGRLYFAEHVRSRAPMGFALQRALTPLWQRLAGGCQLDRDSTGALRSAGFVVEHEVGVGPQRWTLTPMRIGVARKPGGQSA
ncbi:MAG: methyltransferase domain-containing protein [Myxococcota bacterium]